MMTFGDIKAFVAPYVSGGVCPDDQRVLDAVNEAIERLMVKPDLTEHLTIQNVRMWAYGDFVTLPRNIDRILKVRVEGERAGAKSVWFEYMDSGPGLREYDWACGQDLYDLGETATRFDIPTSDTVAGLQLLAMSDQEEDYGETILIRGLDDTGHEVYFNGSIGEPLPIQPAGFAEYSATKFHRINNVIKPKTKGYVYLMTFDPDTSAVFHLSEYHPDETCPRYRRYGFRGYNYDEDDEPVCHELAALVKLRFVPVNHDSDFLQIGNRSAIKTMIQAIHMYDSGDPDKASAYEGLAERMLLDESVNRSGDPSMGLDMQATGWLSGDIPAIL